MEKGSLAHIVVVERAIDLFCGHHHAQRQPATRESFGETEEVWPYIGLLAGEQCASAAKTNGNFIGNEMDAVYIAGSPQQAEIFRVVHAHAASALHQWLDNHCSYFVGMAGEGGFHVRKHLPRMLGRRTTWLTMEGIGRGHRDDFEQQWAVSVLEQVHITHRKGT